MKARLLGELAQEYDSVHGCYRPPGGPCFYIASNPKATDYGNKRGRVFLACREAVNGKLNVTVALRLLIGEMARLTKEHQIGDLNTFCLEVGLAKLREILGRDPETEREEEIILTRESPEAEFSRPPATETIRRYTALKNEILLVLAAHHAKGGKRMPKDSLLDYRNAGITCGGIELN